MRTTSSLLACAAVVVLTTLPLVANAQQDPCMNDPCQAGCAELSYIDSNEQSPGSGVPVHWAPLPIKYKVNPTHVTAGLAEADVIKAVQDAFATWEAVPCSTLSFQYAGTSTSTTEEPGHILVYWGNDGATWIHGVNAWWTDLSWTDYANGEISKSVIGLNATPNHQTYSYDWAIGAEQRKFDIQTAVTWLIPAAIGFSVVSATTNQPPIYYNAVNRTLCESHEKGAQFSYFDSSGSCTRPSDVPPAGGGTPPIGGDGVPPVTGDGPTSTTDGGTGDGPGTGDGTAIGGDPILEPPEDDDGCCRVSHARSGSVPYLTLVGLAILLLLGRRRRR